MNDVLFKKVPSAPTYSISIKGEFITAKGFPVFPVAGKYIINTSKGKREYTIIELVKEAWGVDITTNEIKKIDLHSAVANNKKYSRSDKVSILSQPFSFELQEIIEYNSKNALKKHKRATGKKKVKTKNIKTDKQL